MTPNPKVAALNALAERCEAATGADRELFEQAWLAVFIRTGGDLNIANWPASLKERWDRFSALLDAGAYLDAAMTLVPEGWSRRTENWNGVESAKLQRGATVVSSEAATPALALTAACLRSIAHLEDSHGK